MGGGGFSKSVHFQDHIRWMRDEINRLADNSTNVPDSTMLCIFTKSISCSFGCQMRDRGGGWGGMLSLLALLN